jgi:DNA-directed RNA polymerase specialized sigma24 family protein
MTSTDNVTYVHFPQHGAKALLPPAPAARRPRRSSAFDPDALIQRVAIDDFAAAEELERHYGPRLTRLAYAILLDECEAERVVRKAFAKAFSEWPPEHGQVERWLRQLVSLRARARRRALRRSDS